MNKIILILSVLIFTACSKEEILPTCSNIEMKTTQVSHDEYQLNIKIDSQNDYERFLIIDYIQHKKHEVIQTIQSHFFNCINIRVRNDTEIYFLQNDKIFCRIF